MAEKFNALGARAEDIKRGLSFITKENPFVLEIGCGNGRDAKEILRHTAHYVGIDISESMISVAKAHAPEGVFVVADVENYKFSQGLDAVFSFASLLHSDKDAVRRILQKLHAALNEGGVVFISLKNAHYREESKTDEFGTRHYFFYTPKDIKEMAEGYSVVWENEQDLRGQKWLEIILKKV